MDSSHLNPWKTYKYIFKGYDFKLLSFSLLRSREKALVSILLISIIWVPRLKEESSSRKLGVYEIFLLVVLLFIDRKQSRNIWILVNTSKPDFLDLELFSISIVSSMLRSIKAYEVLHTPNEIQDLGTK